jgi:hypothetical protein
MSSWVRCSCGTSLHRNLIAGARVHVVVEDSVLDALPDAGATSDSVAAILRQSDRLLRCPQCGRIAIIDQSDTITIYSPEA